VVRPIPKRFAVGNVQPRDRFCREQQQLTTHGDRVLTARTGATPRGSWTGSVSSSISIPVFLGRSSSRGPSAPQSQRLHNERLEFLGDAS